MASGGPVVVADLSASDARWPTFANEAADIGVAAMYALPLQIGAIQVGVLDLYRDAPAELAAIDFANALAVAEMVTATLLSPDRTDIPVDAIGSVWDQPIGSREVHQATGMIVAQLGSAPETPTSACRPTPTRTGVCSVKSPMRWYIAG